MGSSHSHSHGGQPCSGHGAGPEPVSSSSAHDHSHGGGGGGHSHGGGGHSHVGGGDAGHNHGGPHVRALASRQDDPRITSLFIAASRGQLMPLVRLMQSPEGVDMNDTDQYGVTPLHRAILKNQVEFVKGFLHLDIDVNIPTCNAAAVPPLHIALVNGDVDVVSALLNAGANVHVKDGDGRNVLHCAALAGDNAVVITHYLISHGLGAPVNPEDGIIVHRQSVIPSHTLSLDIINACDSHGITPLHVAAGSGNIPLTMYLLALGADPLCTDRHGETPTMIAARLGHVELADYVDNGDYLNPIDSDVANYPTSDSISAVSSGDGLPPLTVTQVVTSITVIRNKIRNSGAGVFAYLPGILFNFLMFSIVSVLPPVIGMIFLVVAPGLMVKWALDLSNLRKYTGTKNPALVSYFWGSFSCIHVTTLYTWYAASDLYGAPQILVLLMCLFIMSYALITAQTMNPGIITASPVSFQRVLHSVVTDTMSKAVWCYTCFTARPPRSKHCQICNHCCGRFDHHCGWVNNCIGLASHPWFYLYIVFQLLLHMCQVVWLGEFAVAMTDNVPPNAWVWAYVLTIWTQHPWLMAIYCYNFIVMVMITILVLVQTHQLVVGVTQNESTNVSKYAYLQPYQSKISNNPFNTGLISNLASFLRLLRYPSTFDFGRYPFPMRSSRSPDEELLFEKLRTMINEGGDGPNVDLTSVASVVSGNSHEQSTLERDSLTLSEGMANVLNTLRSTLSSMGKSMEEIDSAVAAAKKSMQQQINMVLALPDEERCKVMADGSSNFTNVVTNGGSSSSISTLNGSLGSYTIPDSSSSSTLLSSSYGKSSLSRNEVGIEDASNSGMMGSGFRKVAVGGNSDRLKGKND